jgi:hypothetical protein
MPFFSRQPWLMAGFGTSTPAMLVHESRILQVILFGTLQHNLNALDFSVLLPDVMTIADEVDVAVDAIDGQLHESHAEVILSVSSHLHVEGRAQTLAVRPSSRYPIPRRGGAADNLEASRTWLWVFW